MGLERTAICKSQLEPIMENPGNTQGAEQVFGRCRIRRRTIPGFSLSATQTSVKMPRLEKLLLLQVIAGLLLLPLVI